MNTDRDESPNYAVDDGSVTHPNLPIHDNYTKLYEQRYPSTEGDERSHTYHGQWRADASGNRFPPVHQYPESSYYPSTVGAYTNSDPSSHHPLYQPAPIAQAAPPNAFHQETFTENPANTIPSSWKGKGKQELLETLLETIGGCDEDRVAQVIQVVRMSATPEEAVAGICQVLGIPGRR